MSQYLSLMVLPPQCAARCTYFTTVLNPRLCENSNPISVIACNFFLVQVSNTVRIPNTRPIPGEYYLHHSVRCDMLDSIPDSGMITVHTTPCTSGPSDRKSGYRPIRCLTVACSYRPPPQPTPEAAKSWWQNNACRQCGSCKRPRDDTLSPTKCNDASDCSTPPTIQRTHRVINEGSSVDKRARVNGTCQEEENMSEQRRLQKRLSDLQARFNVVIDEIEKISALSDACETQLKMRDLHSRTSNLRGSRDAHKTHVRAVAVADFLIRLAGAID